MDKLYVPTAVYFSHVNLVVYPYVDISSYYSCCSHA